MSEDNANVDVRDAKCTSTQLKRVLQRNEDQEERSFLEIHSDDGGIPYSYDDDVGVEIEIPF